MLHIGGHVGTLEQGLQYRGAERMDVYHDADADMTLLAGRQIAVIGYGNQGRAQALNLRDSGLAVIVGNQQDEYAGCARTDGFTVLPISQAVDGASVVILLIPDEVMPALFDAEIAPHLAPGDALVFASGYAITFGLLTPPPSVDVVLVAPRMIGAGVRDLYEAGRGFPAFFGVVQDQSGKARALALALAKGIGATRMGAVEVTFAQETGLDLFTEQCFGPAFGQVLITAVDLLLEAGYPPEAVLLELYMSGEFAYTLAKMAELGLIEQSALHSRTSQYGSLSRGMRFILPELRARMQAGLEEICSGAFAREWAAEQAAGAPTLEALQETARSLPLYQLEHELRQALGGRTPVQPPSSSALGAMPPVPPRQESAGFLNRGLARLRSLRRRRGIMAEAQRSARPPSETELEQVLRAFLARAEGDPALQAFARGRHLTVHYQLSDPDLDFYMTFHDGTVGGGLGTPLSSAEVQLSMNAGLLDSMFTGRTNAVRAAMSGQFSVGGDTRLALAQQQIQGDLIRLYSEARRDVMEAGT
jgi:ketol-acid reductoisomerase